MVRDMHDDVVTVERRDPDSGPISPDGYRSDHMQVCITLAVLECLPPFTFLSSVIIIYNSASSPQNASRLCDFLRSICVNESFSYYSDDAMDLLDRLWDVCNSQDPS
jgi:hypothetical protein